MKILIYLIFLVSVLAILSSYLLINIGSIFWFLILNLIGVISVIFLKFILKKSSALGYNYFKKFKFFVFVVLMIAAGNFSFLFLETGIKVLKKYRFLNVISNPYNNKIENIKNVVLKGQVYSLVDPSIPVVNAKMILRCKETNIVVDIFYTDPTGEFYYDIGNFDTENRTFELKIEHPNFKVYTTEFRLLDKEVKEFELYLMPK
ncbi:MAG: hypothetical protein N2643_01310 [Endomicrobia bacterium]|nr:hypothetical protein [Endomicrobiia bacterium]